MAKSIYVLKQEVERLEAEYATLPPSFMAPTLTERDNLIARYNRVTKELDEARKNLAKAEELNARLLANVKVKPQPTETVEVPMIEVTDDPIELVENSEEDISEEEE